MVGTTVTVPVSIHIGQSVMRNYFTILVARLLMRLLLSRSEIARLMTIMETTGRLSNHNRFKRHYTIETFRKHPKGHRVGETQLRACIELIKLTQ